MRSAPLTRRTPLRKINPERRAKSYARNFGSEADIVRSMPCLVRGCSHPSEAAHVRARGMGGTKGDRHDLVPLCRVHHEEASEHRTARRAAFEVVHGLCLALEAQRVAAHCSRVLAGEEAST